MYKKQLLSVLILCLFVPLLVVAGFFLVKGKQYLLVSLLVIAAAMLPFFLSLEQKKLKVRELVVTASIAAIAVASRGAFFFLPQIKPMCAILVIAAVAFGAEFGFVCGALSMLLSNFIFGQGMWTPFQMAGMGVTVFVTALLIRTLHVRNRLIIGVLSGMLCFLLYGLIVDLGSVFMMVSVYSVRTVLSVYMAGLPFNLIHGVTTGVLVAVFQPQIHEKLERIQIKYGLFETEKTKY